MLTGKLQIKPHACFVSSVLFTYVAQKSDECILREIEQSRRQLRCRSSFADQHECKANIWIASAHCRVTAH